MSDKLSLNLVANFHSFSNSELKLRQIKTIAVGTGLSISRLLYFCIKKYGHQVYKVRILFKLKHERTP